MEHFTPLPALIGGLIIGLSTSLMLAFNGRIAGISGILGALLAPAPGDTRWRIFFVGGLIAGGVGMWMITPDAFQSETIRSPGVLAAAGLLVGFGTRLGSGCTSGHGVCGNSRLSVRSMVSSVTFIAAGAATVALTRLLVGGV
ncbi:MAG TPA: YeeE/YedE family protein [Myxococcota bacterium]|nr:YeeE/YedE family protein [Myxococcota bacterium]